MTVLDPTSAGFTLIAVAAIAYGGTFLLRIVNGRAAANELQRTYFRAGHAHAGVLVTLGLVVQLLLADARVPDWGPGVGGLVLWSAILMPAGFFLSVTGRDPHRPNRLRMLIWAGAAVLTVGAIGAGAALVIAGQQA